ncbi:iron-containing alcohol dehydrogenase [Pedobacter sp. SAFR-022]|uniref:iron-containing alcohol dehydrogenase n=1 Tax=Pedobacter sp. SAFR-022 TaxID=3436861 RepID=UPI003F82292C
MIYKQLAYIPIIFQVDEAILLSVPELLQRNNFYFNKVVVVSGKSFSSNYAVQLCQNNSWTHFVLKDNTFAEVERLKQFSETSNCDLIIAIGGGKVLDVVKRVSYLTNLNHLSVPTIISNDGLISPISVIKNHHGKTESISGMMPMGVIIDLDIIQKSPVDYIRAAAGDILSNISATNDWILANKEKGESINDIGFHLSRSAANALIYFNRKVLKDKAFLRMIVQGQINSGIAMSLAGSSRPCSGSEHLISHAIDFLDLSKTNVLHGNQVASISLFTLFLQDKLLNVHVEYALATGIMLNFTNLLHSTDKLTLQLLYQKAREMRPGRFTILDMITEDLFVQRVQAFGVYMQEKVKP